MNNKTKLTVEWIGSILGIAGAILLASNTSLSGYGFIFFLFSSLCFIWFGLIVKAYGIAIMQAVFLVIDMVGIYRWIIL